MEGILSQKGYSSGIWFLFIEAKELYYSLVMMCYLLKTKMLWNGLVYLKFSSSFQQTWVWSKLLLKLKNTVLFTIRKNCNNGNVT